LQIANIKLKNEKQISFLPKICILQFSFLMKSPVPFQNANLMRRIEFDGQKVRNQRLS